MIYTVTFNPALDYVMAFDTLHPGAANRAGWEELSPGGKGINVSLILKELGVPSVALGFTAGRMGQLLTAWLTELGVTADFIGLPAGETRINVKVKAQGEETELNGAGPAIPGGALDQLADKLSALREGDTLVLSGSAPSSLPRNVYDRLLRALPDGVRAVVDAEGELLLSCLSHRPFLIKPNLRELEGLCRRDLSPDDTPAIAECARDLRARGARNVLVSLGGDGALLLTEEGEVFTCPAVGGMPVNTVGAGDSMVAGFLAGCDAGGYAEGLRLGSAAGSATACSPRLATGEEIQRTYRLLS